ncbi:MAG: PQQ-binding-like beta-propeller repeat protein, partial [Lentisphaeria bacterium]|nr:PQQ-binding-like beta-propeller repeat protein [Lentisphaeria bacterium]
MRTMLLWLLPLSVLSGADWPQWRHDAGRTSASPDGIDPELDMRWEFSLPPLEPCWQEPVNRERMPFDAAYEPVVGGGILVVGSNRDDTVRALDAGTGALRWTAVTDGPVRLPPAIRGNKVFAVSDDGFLRALALDSGRELWRVRGGPDGRKVLGNGRLVSAWCARGGPVVEGPRVVFGAGIWPFMGTAI